MNTVLELQELAHDTDGKGQAAEATVISTIAATTCVTTTVITAGK
ncbi:class III lanthipeptide [Paenibacillus thiaminolyticus]|nr:class III lanthipeptide [Paenibacillus dendritiformis]GIO75363.1 hypothetical protein J27TS7_48770 [Paenibacillus dendritiformis]